MVCIVGLKGLSSVIEGCDLASLIIETAQIQGVLIEDHDIFVVAQKIVSKAEGRVFQLKNVKPSEKAKKLAVASGQEKLVSDIEKHLELYKLGRSR